MTFHIHNSWVIYQKSPTISCRRPFHREERKTWPLIGHKEPCRCIFAASYKARKSTESSQYTVRSSRSTMLSFDHVCCHIRLRSTAPHFQSGIIFFVGVLYTLSEVWHGNICCMCSCFCVKYFGQPSDVLQYAIEINWLDLVLLVNMKIMESDSSGLPAFLPLADGHDSVLLNAHVLFKAQQNRWFPKRDIRKVNTIPQ